MKNLFSAGFFLFALCLFSAVYAQTKPNGAAVKIETSAALQTLATSTADEAVKEFSAKNLKAENLSISILNLRDGENLKNGNYRGEEKMYPASVVKLFYLAALHEWLENGKLKFTPALERVMKDMIVDSSNEATQYAVDALTETHNGEELSEKDLKKYGDKRDAVNRYFAKLGYQNINVNQKTYGEDLYGRERQWWNAGKNRNMLTTNATARLMAEIALGKSVNQARSTQMMTLLKRDWEMPAKNASDNDDQAHGFTALALKDLPGTKLWSKAGWTSTARHDAAYVETPDGLRLVLVVFTNGVANERDIIPFIARNVIRGLREIK